MANDRVPVGYDFPLPIDPGKRRCWCIELPDADEYNRAFRDLILSFTHWFTWRRDGDDNGAAVAAMMRDIIAPQLKDDFMCCCDTIDYLATTQANHDFATWATQTPTEINPNAPDTTYSTDSHDNPTQAGQTIDALCYACGAYVDWACETAKQYIHNPSSFPFQFTVVATVILIAGIEFITGGLATPLVLAIASVTPLIAAWLAANLDDAILDDTGARADVKCQLYNQLQGQTITLANWNAAIAALDGSGNASLISQWIQQINGAPGGADQKNFDAFTNALGDARVHALAGLVPECDCCATPDLFYDWYNGVDDLSDFTVINTTDFPPSLSTTLNDSSGTYTGELHANADGMGHSFVFPSAGGFTLAHEATGLSFNVDPAGCRVKRFEVMGNNDASGDCNSKLWYHDADGWHFAATLDFTAIHSPTTLGGNVDLPDVDMLAILNYGALNMYMAQLRIIFG